MVQRGTLTREADFLLTTPSSKSCCTLLHAIQKYLLSLPRRVKRGKARMRWLIPGVLRSRTMGHHMSKIVAEPDTTKTIINIVMNAHC